MTINLYETSADPRALDKLSGATLINQTPITVKPTEKVNLLAPIFEVEYSDSYLTANYLYCDTFDRYYYISNPAVRTGNRIEIACSIDVRQSFAASIRASKGVILRAASKGAPTRYPDSKLPVYPTGKIITSIELPEINNELDTNGTWSYLLTVVGDGQ